MAKKSKKNLPEEDIQRGKKAGKNGKTFKNSKDDVVDNGKPAKTGRAMVAQTSSWTGKLPGSLLHEHCQKQKWGKVEYDMKKLPEGFIAVPQISWENPKTKENIQIKFYPPKHIVKPQETPIEARHYAATYALHRIAFNKNIHMVLPSNHKALWSELEAERKSITNKYPSRAKLDYSNDPFSALLEKRREDEARKKESEVREAAVAKVKKPAIIIGSQTNNNVKTNNELKVDNGTIRSDKGQNLGRGKFDNLQQLSFPKKVWDNSVLFDINPELRVSIEDSIRNHIEWSDEESSVHEYVSNTSSYTELLVQLGFRKVHVLEAVKYTYTLNDSLEWLIFHLPEDDLPFSFVRDETDSSVRLKITKDLNKERLITQLMRGGYSRNESIFGLEHCDYDITKAAVLLTNNLFEKSLSLDYPDGLSSLEDWLEEKNSLRVIYDSKIVEDDPPKDDSFSILLDVSGLASKLLSLKVYRSQNYPYDICGLLLVVNDKSYTLPSYIKKSIISQLIEYLAKNGAFGMPYIYTCIDWLEHNILKVIENPGPLYISSNELKKSKGLLTVPKIQGQKKTTQRRISEEKVEISYKARIGSSKYQESINKRAKLPAWKQRELIVRTINENNVCLITGETGSGKSTQIVQFILDDLNKRNDFLTTIICTQPRRISAIGLADRVSEERVDKCGSETGYIIRGENRTSDTTRISFVTTGVMLRMIQSIFGKNSSHDSFFENLGYIFIDEVHERSIDSDFLLIILKKMTKNFPKLKIILMSATIEKSIFNGYFDPRKSQIAHVHIDGRTFPIDDYYLDDIIDMTDFKISNYRSNPYDDALDKDETFKPRADSKYFQSGNINYDLIAALVYKVDDDLNAKQDDGSILIFLPGVMEIKKCLNKIEDAGFWKLQLHSALSSQEQRRIFDKPPTGKRKVIASTNIAETSITIPDAVVVIDSGKVKSVQYDSKSNNTKLVEIWASQAETKQRRGRAGRIRNGICYKLFTRGTEQKMISQPIPEIKRTKLESVYLVVKAIGVKNVYEFLQAGLDPPDEDNVNNARRVLCDVGALNLDSDNLTCLGKYLSMLPTDIKSGKLLIFGCIFGCVESCSILAAIGVTGSPFTCKQEDRDRMKTVQQKFGQDSGDMVAILNAFNEFQSLKSMKEKRRFCSENFVSILRLNDIESTKFQYMSCLKELGFIPLDYGSVRASNSEAFDYLNRNGKNTSMIQALVTASSYPQIARVQLPETKYAQINGGAVALDPEFRKIRYWIRNEKHRRLLENEGGKGPHESGETVYPSSRVFMHPSSSLFINEEKSSTNPPFVVYNDSQETSKLYVYGITPTSVTSILLFGGRISYDLTGIPNNIRCRGIIMDSWLPIRTWCKNAVLIGKLRLLLDKTINARLENPGSHEGNDVLEVIEKLVKCNV